MISAYKYATHCQLSKDGYLRLNWKTNRGQLSEIIASVSVFTLIWVLLCLL